MAAGDDLTDPAPKGTGPARLQSFSEEPEDRSDPQEDEIGPVPQPRGSPEVDHEVEVVTEATVPAPVYGYGGAVRPAAVRRGDAGVGADRGRGRAAAVPFDEEDYSRENLPPVADHEVELLLPNATSYSVAQSERSETRTVGNFRFRILVFPAGTHTSAGQQVSAFVECDPQENLDPRFVFHGVKYQVAVINWLDYRKSVQKTDTWSFSKDGIDRGWHDMVRTVDLSQETGWLGPNNTLLVRASCYVRQADGINAISDYNCRRETGHIGLMNHGATCYMNGLLQSLFHVGEFRRIVYSIDLEENRDVPATKDPKAPTQEEPSQDNTQREDAEGKTPSLIQALQNVFYRLQTAEQAVNCKELMKSFGWDTMDAFTQHDAQELNRILCDRLEEQMKGTRMDGSIKRLFEGEMENFIECIDVDYKSRRNETFYDIQLNIKGERGQELRTIEESLREFTTEETLEGDNAYEAEGHGKQRAKKGIRFLTFPPVLNLQLKRFHFDLEKMDMVKLNTHFKFDRTLDLNEFAPGAGTYILHAVVVHSGDVNSGHYYAHIRPILEGGWFKFDDDTVTPCSEFAAVEDNYGGSDLNVWNYFERSPRELRSQPPPTRPRIHNAYMLVYIREDLAHEVLRVPDPVQTNPRMVERCEREVRMAEQRHKEKMEQQTRIRIKLVFEKDICKMTGFWDHTEVPSGETLKMGRDQQVKDLATEAERITEVPRAHMALFVLHYRSNPRQVRFNFMPINHTLRNFIPQFNAPHFDTSDPYLTVLCVASKGYDPETMRWKAVKDAKPDELSRWHDDTVTLLIVKYFCPQKQKIVTLGCYYMRNDEALILMVTEGWVTERLKQYINSKEVAPLPEGAETFTWDCWEEFSNWDIQPRNSRKTAKAEQLWSGDVVIWQPTVKSSDIRGPEVAPPSPTTAAVPEIAPTYPINNVSDLAAHIQNSVDVVVTLHDCYQPLCVDGIVSNGVWGLPRPQSAAKDSPAKEERPEDFSVAKFQPPREQEFKMDLRWQLHHVTGTIARAFGLKTTGQSENEAQLWLFHTAPSSTCEEPLNLSTGRIEQPTLKDLQRNVAYHSSSAGKKPLALHAVELPFAGYRQVIDQGLCPVCLRFFDDAIREVGSTVLLLDTQSTVQELLAKATEHLQEEWGIRGPLRALEVLDGRLQRVCKPEQALRTLGCIGKSNIFYHCIRVEADPDTGRMPEGHRLVEIFHCDRQSQQAFAQPVLLAVAPGETSGSLKTRCKERLRVPDSEFKSWRLVRCGSRAGRTHLKDDEPWDSDLSPDARLCLEHVHPNPNSSFSRVSRYNKPLTIK